MTNDADGLTRRKLLGRAAAAALALALPEVSAPAASPAGVPPLPADRVAPVVPPKALPFDLADVRLLPGPFLEARERDRRYLLGLEPDRLLHRFRADAGLPPRAPVYGGWESQDLSGHTLGHYLSACSLMYRSTGDPRLASRVAYIVGELALCQNANGNGYVAAIPNGKALFARAGADGTLRGWAPWYTLHKQMAGLRDAHLLCGSAQARDVLTRLADWADATTRGLTDAQFQKMLLVEHGGMNEVLADTYALTGDPKYLALARRFCHRQILDPLARREDALDGLHSNTQIPKVIGFGRFHELTGESDYGVAARFFWETVTGTRSFVTGGNGESEHFFPPTQFPQRAASAATMETCCTYNMLRLTRLLFTQAPSAAYADYYERALLNNILASQDPDQGMVTYFSPTKPGHFKVYCTPTESFWCCTGTGMENHAKYNDSIYFHSGRALYVNLFIASDLRWHERAVTVRQDTRFPEADTTRLTLTCARPTRLALLLRCPAWTRGMTVAVNGRPVPVTARPGSYATVERTWRSGDVVEVRLPMALSREALPHDPGRAALLYGPVVLAGALGREGMDGVSEYAPDQLQYARLPAPAVPALAADGGDVLAHVAPVPGSPLTFRAAARPADVTLIPYYRLHHQRYNLYWDVPPPGPAA